MTENNKAATQQASASNASEEEKKTKEVTKEQVLQSALGYFLPLIMQRQRENDLAKKLQRGPFSNYKNVFQILYEKGKTEKQMPAYTNILTKKDANKDICDLDIFKNLEDNSLFLNQAVPYVKIYKTLKDKDGNIIDINLPFDVVTSTDRNKPGEDITDRILRGGSGGSVGIVDFSWQSEGRNEANNSLYTVNFKLFLQDIYELERIRNMVGQNSVKILDLLYYGFLPDSGKQEGAINQSIANEDVYNPDYLEFKAEVGFSLPSTYQEYEQYFKTLLDLRVYKHNFTFKESGNVELDITAIGNIESSYSNKVNYNILEIEDIRKIQMFIKEINSIKNGNATVSTKIKRLKELFSKYKNDFDTIIQEAELKEKEEVGWKDILRILGSIIFAPPKAASEIYTEQERKIVENYQAEPPEEKLQELIQAVTELLKRKQKILKVNILNNIFKDLINKEQIKYLVLSKDDYEKLKYFISFGDVLLDNEIQVIKQQIDGIVPPTIETIEKNAPDPILEVNIQEPVVKWNLDSLLGTFTIKENNFKKIREKINESKSPEQQSEIVPFVFLGDLMQAFIDQNTDLNNNINIFLSPFSYYNYIQTFSNLSNSSYIIKTKKSNKGEATKTTHVYNVQKEIGEMYNIPISISTIQKWFIDSVLSMEEEAYTFNKLLKYFTSDLIRQNISGKIAPAAPNNVVKINPYYFSAKDDNLSFFKEAATIENLSGFYAQRLTTSQEFGSYKKNIAFISTAEFSIQEGSFTGDKIIDCKNNIIHLPVNSMYSFVKKISFSRDDDARLETANLQARTDAHANEIVRQVYQANVDMYGNIFFEPGNLVFLKPNFPGTDLDMDTMYRIGLGGYYRVIEITNKLSVGGFSTSLKCMWEMSRDGTENVVGVNPISEIYVQSTGS